MVSVGDGSTVLAAERRARVLGMALQLVVREGVVVAAWVERRVLVGSTAKGGGGASFWYAA